MAPENRLGVSHKQKYHQKEQKEDGSQEEPWAVCISNVQSINISEITKSWIVRVNTKIIGAIGLIVVSLREKEGRERDGEVEAGREEVRSLWILS